VAKCHHNKWHCKECHPKQFCPHGRPPSRCKECGGSRLCPHGKRKDRCVECGGSSYCCLHGKQKWQCKECGIGFCSHGIRRNRCKECGGSNICSHGKRVGVCSLCGPVGVYKQYVANEKRQVKRQRQCSICHPAAVYSAYRSDERRHFGLPEGFMTLETFCRMVKLPCRWCGRTPEQANGMGVDRRDNGLPHLETNIAPCCAECNYARRDRTEEDFGAWILSLAAFHQ